VRGINSVSIYCGLRGEWRWTARARNGRIIGASSEGYRDRTRAIQNLHAVTGIRVTVARSEIRARLISRRVVLAATVAA
jgi:uncharacterized protein YegP (UPF0339 family)